MRSSRRRAFLVGIGALAVALAFAATPLAVAVASPQGEASPALEHSRAAEQLLREGKPAEALAEVERSIAAARVFVGGFDTSVFDRGGTSSGAKSVLNRAAADLFGFQQEARRKLSESTAFGLVQRQESAQYIMLFEVEFLSNSLMGSRRREPGAAASELELAAPQKRPYVAVVLDVGADQVELHQRHRVPVPVEGEGQVVESRPFDRASGVVDAARGQVEG